MGNGHSIDNGRQPTLNSMSGNYTSPKPSNSGGYTFNNNQDSQINQSQASPFNQKSSFQLYIDDPDSETKKSIERDLILKQDDFKTPLLQSVYEGDKSTLDADLEMTKRTQFTYKYEQDLMLVFWLAVHLENLDIAQALVKKEKLIKKLVACISLKNNQNTKKSSIDMMDSRADSNSPMTHADVQKQFFNHGSSNTYSTQSKQQNQRKPPLYNNEYGEEQEFESENFSSNELSQSQLRPPSDIQIESTSSNNSSFVQSSSSSEISRSLQIQIDEQRRYKLRQQQFRQQNQLFEGGDKEDSKKRKKSKKRSKKQTEESIGAEEKKSSSSNGNHILPIKSISNYKEMPNIVATNPKQKLNDAIRNTQGQEMEAPQSNGKLTVGLSQSQIESNFYSKWGSNNNQDQKLGSNKFQQNSYINDNSMSLSSRQIIPPTKNNKPEKTLGQYLREFKLAQQEQQIRRVSNKNSYLDAYLEQQGITPEQVERVEFITMEDLLRLKQHFKTDSMTVMSQILKLAISMGENKLTWIITLEYEITIEEEMFANAIFKENYQWLYYVWAARKNFIVDREEKNSNFITFEQLFEMILKISKDGKFRERKRTERNIQRVLDWRIQSDDNIKNNIIRCLLAHHLDILAVDYMGVYNKLLNKDLLIYCIDHGNIYFLRNALLLAAFDKMLFREDLVILELLTILKKGYSTNFILNILSLIDISVWKNKRLKSLIEIINDYVDEKYSRNRLLLSANPLMSISIACELLNKIADARRKFESECFQIQQELLKLGQMYTKKIEDETYYESILMAKDFSGRNLIKIITQNSFEKLMEEKDPKAERVMMMIWRGKEAAHCDGDIFGYSNLVHVIMSKPKKIMERNNSQFMQIVTNFFQMNIKMNYSFQYRFRIESIQFYFYKEFLCAFLMLIIFQYVNYRYLLLFSNKSIKGIDGEFMISNKTDTFEINNQTEQYEVNLNRVKESVKSYIEYNFWVIFFSAALIFQHLLKVLFNFYSDLKIGLDKWTVMDVLSASLNIIAMVLINQVNPSAFLQPRVKDLIDYFMLLVLTVSWLRFFSYYLVVRSISKLLLTLIEMIGDTLSFLFIVSCFILIMSSIFATLYQDNYPEKYGGLAKTVTTLFNGVVAQYSYDDEEMKGRVISHSILTITHVFFTNIILMNYLIAILSSTYGKMKESGIFSFKVNLYQYCERYLIAFKDRDYGEMVMHPPPLAFIVGIIIPFSCSRILMTRLSKWMSYLMYWLENIVYIAIFMIFEVFISPIAYFKIWYNLFLIVRTTGIGTTGLVKGGIYCLIWAFLGPFIMIWINLMDLRNFMIILKQHDGFTRTKQEKIAANRADDSTKLQLYNETRGVVISLYQKIIRLIAKESLVQQTPYPNLDQLSQDESSDEDDFERIPDFFIIEDQQQMNMSNVNDEQHYFLLRKSLIIEEWKKRRILIERRLRLKQNDFSSSGDASNNRLDMLTKTLRRGMKNKPDYFTKERQRRQSTPFIHWEKTTLNIQKQKQQSKNGRGGDLTTHIKGAFLEKIAMTMQKKINEEDKVDMSDFVVPEDEEAVVDQFLSKFTIKDNLSLAFNLLENMPESGQKDIIDIKLMINALPNRIMNYGLENVEMFNFRIFQESLHAYQNLDIVKVFEFFDKKNKERIQIVRNRLLYQKELIADSNDLLEKVIEKFEASPTLGTIPNSQEAAELKKKWMLSKQQTNAANALKKQPENAFNRMNSINYGAMAQRSPSIIVSVGAAGSSNNNLTPGDDSASNNASNMRRSSQNNSADAGITSQRHADKRAKNMFQPTAN